MKSRRSFFKTITACVAASAMEVCGWVPVVRAVRFDPAFSVGGDKYFRTVLIMAYPPHNVTTKPFVISYKRNEIEVKS